jgi:hypothetical protein
MDLRELEMIASMLLAMTVGNGVNSPPDEVRTRCASQFEDGRWSATREAGTSIASGAELNRRLERAKLKMTPEARAALTAPFRAKSTYLCVVWVPHGSGCMEVVRKPSPAQWETRDASGHYYRFTEGRKCDLSYPDQQPKPRG